jgi:phosphatidyl-myo-inositol dimannoside synthase
VTPSCRRLLFVSAGLDLDGGGRAAAGRLLAAACAGYASRRGLGFAVLALGHGGGPEGTLYHGASQRSLALGAWRRQWRSRDLALVFDLLGPARVQAYLPAPARAPYLIPLYGIEVWRRLGWDRRRALAGAAVRFASSRFTLERARPFWPRGGDPGGVSGVPVVPLALEERPPEGAVDVALLRRLGKGFLLIVGRMASGERYKGHDQVLDALLRLPDARLVVTGGGDDRPRLAARAAELGLSHRVVFTGFVSEATLAELYRRCAVFVMPSLGEGFGLVFLEAMRAGKPCVAARASAAEEIVADGETGRLVPQDDPLELAGALRDLLASPGAARRMGEAGRRRWRADFGTDRFRTRLEPLLDRLTGARPACPAPPGD